MIKKLKALWNLLRLRSMSPEKHARKLGVNIGSNCYISTRHFSTEPFLITIGNNVRIASDVRFFTHGGTATLKYITNRKQGADVFGKISVGDNTYIGEGTYILPGVKIGKNVVIGAASVVSKSVPDGVVVGGNPARIITTIEKYAENKYQESIDNYKNFDEKKRILLSGNYQFIEKPYLKFEPKK